jgi:signal transduction histidine kinase
VPEERDRNDMLLEAGLTLASELSLPIVLQRLVDLAAQVTDARYGALGVIGDDGVLIEFVTTGIPAHQRRKIGPPPRGRGVLGHLISDPRPILIPRIAEHPKSVGFPANHPPMTSFLGAPVLAMGKVYGNIYLTEKRDAAEFSKDDERAIVVLAAQAGVAIANASLYQALRIREQWLEALRDVTVGILSDAAADTTLPRIAEHARELADAETATILSTTDVPGQLVVAAAVGKNASSVLGRAIRSDTSISGVVIETGRPLVFEDASLERKAHPLLIKAGLIGPAIFVPMRARGLTTGTLMVANRKGGPLFPHSTVRLVETFADQASVAIEYERAQADRKRVGLMDERERIARELHDGIIQSLFAVGMGLQGTAQMVGPTATGTRIEGAVEELDKVIRDLRNYIFGLRPGILADRQLDQAMQVLGQEVHASSGIKVEVDVDRELAAALSGRSADIVQLAREALSNAARHARATRAAVRLARRGSQAVLTIADDGIGFDPMLAPAGSGLRNMRERVAALGGSVRISSRDGKGTTLRMSFPSGERARPKGPATTGRPAVRRAGPG